MHVLFKESVARATMSCQVEGCSIVLCRTRHRPFGDLGKR